jgi:hypothetical protein
VVICGPSGVGKGTLLTRLIQAHPDRFGFCVSHTTRAPRPGEINGVHYHFCDVAEMEAAIGRGEFLEHARVHSNIYGTSLAAVEAVSRAGKTCLLDIDVRVAGASAPSPPVARAAGAEASAVSLLIEYLCQLRTHRQGGTQDAPLADPARAAFNCNGAKAPPSPSF